MQATSAQRPGNFELDSDEWLHFGDTPWEAADTPDGGGRVVMGWVTAMDMSRANTITVNVVNSQADDGSTEHTSDPCHVTFQLTDTFMPQLVASTEDLTFFLKIGAYLHVATLPHSQVSLTQLSIFLNRPAVLKAWQHTGTIPCFSDVFRLLTFYRMSVPPPGSYHGSGSGAVQACPGWMALRDSPATTPSAFTGTRTASFFCIANTPIVIDTATHTIFDARAAPCTVALPCVGGAICGEVGAGKFSCCLHHAMKTAPCPGSGTRTYSRAALFIVPAGGLAGRLSQARQAYPGAAIVKISTNSDLLRVTWERLIRADYIFTTFQFISTKQYLQHFNKVVYTLATGPARLSAEQPQPRQTAARKRRRVVCTDDEEVDAGRAFSDEFDVDLSSSKDTRTCVDEDAGFAITCARRSLQSAALPWEDLTTPVLEVLEYRHVFFIDCDRQQTPPRRLKHFSGEVRWVTAVLFPSSSMALVLPPEVERIPNAVAKQDLVQFSMTFTITHEAASPRPLSPSHAFISSTPKELMLMASSASDVCKGLEPANASVINNTHFMKRVDMYEGVLAAARERIERVVAQRNGLREQLERHAADVAAGTATSLVIRDADTNAEINYEYWGELAFDEEDNVEEEGIINIYYNMAGDADDDEDIDIDDDDDDDDDDEDNYDEDESGDEDDELRALEEIMLEATPERMTAKMHAYSLQIEEFERDEEAFKTRVAQTIESVINAEACIICSQAKSNAMPACGHAFCTSCLSTWCDAKGTCPACNKTVDRIIAQEECIEIPAPDAKHALLWERVWRVQDLSSLLFWFVSTLRTIEEQGRRGVVVLTSSTAGRALSRALAAENVTAKHFAGSLTARLKTMASFSSGEAHVIASSTDILAGAGFPGAKDVVFGDDVNLSAPQSSETHREAILHRFRGCCNVFTYTRIRSHTDA